MLGLTAIVRPGLTEMAAPGLTAMADPKSTANAMAIDGDATGSRPSPPCSCSERPAAAAQATERQLRGRIAAQTPPWPAQPRRSQPRNNRRPRSRGATGGTGLTTGTHSAGLDFPVVAAEPDSPSVANPFATAATTTPPSSTASTARAAAETLLGALIARDATAAWSALSGPERERAGYAQRLIDEVSGAGWQSYVITGETAGRVTAQVRQSPKVSDIDGVIAATATVTLPTMQTDGGYSVNWSRRQVEQLYPKQTERTDRAVGQAVLRWAEAHQGCAPAPHEYAGGLIGVVGLASALCHSNGTPRDHRSRRSRFAR